MPTATPAKFTARNLPALEKLARECGLEHSFRHDSKCYSFSPNALVDGNFPPSSDEDRAAIARFVAAAERTFGNREDFCAYSAFGFARVSWRRDPRTPSQLNNCD